MIAQEHLFARLSELLQEGMLARSTCSRQFLAFVAPLLHSGIILEERSGAGRRLTLLNAAALEAFIRDKFPGATLAPDASTRELGVGRFRDTKSFRSDTPEIVTVRAWSEAAFASDQPASGQLSTGRVAVRATADYGLFSFLTAGGAGKVCLDGAWALVENPVVFQRFERLGVPAHAVLYGRGRLSNLLLDWIKAHITPEFSLVHLPDYDPAGLSEHYRLRSMLGTTVRLYEPDDLEQRFARFSNSGLLQRPRNGAMLAALRNSGNQSIRRVVNLIDTFNGGLEQEALLVDYKA